MINLHQTYACYADWLHDQKCGDPKPERELRLHNPEIGQKYLVVFYCDYDNTEYGENYTVEVTEENIDDLDFHMNDLENDITEYILITE